MTRMQSRDHIKVPAAQSLQATLVLLVLHLLLDRVSNTLCGMGESNMKNVISISVQVETAVLLRNVEQSNGK